MTPDWTPLRVELELWRAEGLRLPLWWRDDDASVPTEALDRLAGLSRATGLPVHLAIVPAWTGRALADAVAEAPFIPVVHGWAHVSHAAKEAKKAEYGPDRSPEEMAAEARNALARLAGLFGTRLAPMFVPPWNRIAPQLLPALPDAGYATLSTFTPRRSAEAAPGLAQVNTHLDPVDWRGTRSLVDADALIARTLALLEDRRAGRADATEPLGLLTHHLDHDAAIWDFTARWLDEMRRGPVDVWIHPAAGV